MDLKKLKYFKAVYENRGLAGASKQIFISQAALSIAIKSLEDELNVALFTRENRRFQATQYGHALYERAQGLEQQIGDISRTFASIAKGSIGEALIGVSPGEPTKCLAEAVKKIVQDDADVMLRVESGLHRDLIASLRAGDIELVVSRCRRVSTEPDLAVDLLGTEEYVVVGNVNHPLAKKRSVSLQEISQCSFAMLLTPRGKHMKRTQVQLWDELFEMENLNIPRQLLQSNSLDFLKSLLMKSQALSVLPLSSVEDDIQSHRLCKIRISKIKLVVPFGVTYMKSRPLSSICAAVLAKLRAGSRNNF